MYWFPSKGRNPLGMSLEGVSNRLTGLRIPQSDQGIVSPGRQFPFHRFPLDAENPTLMAAQNMRGRFGVKVPESRGSVSRTGG